MPHPFRLRFAALAVLLLSLSFRASAEPVEVYPAKANSLSLNGTWEFAYRAGPADVSTLPAFHSSIQVPGHWELQGFAEPKYGKELLEGLGYYRRTFRVPAAWRGQRIMLRFDGVLSGFDARVNGAKVGSWASGYNAVTFDVTDQVKFDADNQLNVDATTRSHGWEFDTNDCWSLSGIYRDVTLLAVPQAHLERLSIVTTVPEQGKLAAIRLTAQLSHPTRISGVLRNPQGIIVERFGFPELDETTLATSLYLKTPELWTAETPSLYSVELTLSSGQKITEKIGVRQVSIVDGVLQLNGRPVKLRGVNHHDLWPDTGRTTDEAKLRRDLELIKAANCNFVRTSHYPPHPRLIELCDELGLYVMDEVPFGFGEKHLDDENYRAALLTRAEATVRRDANRPSVIIWSIGNENQNTPITLATARRVKELDPTRPVCFPQIGSYFAKSYGELPDDIDIYAPHYPSLATVKDYAAKLTRPVIFTEYAHALGLATDQVQAQWAVMQASPRLAGGAIWMFQDQGILRTAPAGQTPASTHELGLAVWPDAKHYYATSGNQGTDGIVYSDRTPQTDYWQLRKVYSPIQIALDELTVTAGRNQLGIPVENRFDFRSLAGCKLEWALVANDRTLQSGSLPLQAAAHATETVTIAVDAPANLSASFAWLELRCRDENGAPVYERSIRLQPAGTIAPKVVLAAKFSSGKLSLDETPDAVTVGHPDFRLTVTRATGEITLRDTNGTVLATGLQPHAGRRLTEGEFVRAKKENPWRGALLPAGAPPEITATRGDGTVTLRLRSHHPRPDVADEALAGEAVLTVHATGLVDVAYDYVPVNGHGLLLEAGFALRAADAATEFHWVGDGPYPGYPGKDALNEFGRFHLNRGDLNFSGNRRSVELAALVAPSGAGVLLIPDGAADIAIEDYPEGVVLSHNAVLAGRGTKFVGPDVYPKAEETAHIAGRFTLLPLAKNWPAALRAALGEPGAAKPFNPYYHSYDR